MRLRHPSWPPGEVRDYPAHSAPALMAQGWIPAEAAPGSYEEKLARVLRR